MTAEDQQERRIVLAADELTLDRCLDLTHIMGGRLYAPKVHILFDRHGPGVISKIKEHGARYVWMDAKLCDIPNTVGRRAKEYRDVGVDILTVMASGGIEMMMAAVEKGPSRIYAVTILTSLSEEETCLVYGMPPKAAVLNLARMAKLAGVHGVVCSPQEVEMLAKRPELKGLEFVVPGIRSAGKDAGDQKRIGTPGAAIKAGATRLVIGRQLTDAKDPVAELDAIEAEIAAALAA